LTYYYSGKLISQINVCYTSAIFWSCKSNWQQWKHGSIKGLGWPDDEELLNYDGEWHSETLLWLARHRFLSENVSSLAR